VAAKDRLKRLLPWRLRHRLRRLQRRLDPRRDIPVPLHTLGQPPVPFLGRVSNPSEALWDDKHENEISSSWTNNPQVVSAVETRQTGQPGRFWLGWLFEEQLKEPVERVVSIGCGAGSHEIMISHERWANQIDAFDASSAGIEKARAHAAQLGLDNIDFQVSTFEEFAENGPDSPTYDVALFAGSLHHVRDLEGMLSRVRRCLKPNGRVLFSEYVGPLYSIYPPDRVAILNRVLRSIPAEFKREADVQWVNPTIDEVMRQDPSEGVRSSIVLDVLGMYFDFELKRDFGGGLLHPLFDLLDAERLADGSIGSRAVISMLIETEDLLTEHGIIDSDMCFGICRHKA